jgi:hypothetical protein
MPHKADFFETQSQSYWTLTLKVLIDCVTPLIVTVTVTPE